MTDTKWITHEAFGRYPLYFRQALRFILEIGGPEALARFEHLMSEVFQHPIPTTSEEHESARKFVTEMVVKDFALVREKPDLM